MPKGTTKKKASGKLKEIEDQLRRGIYLPDKKIPNFKQVAEDWIEFKKPNLRHSTWSVYEGHRKPPKYAIGYLKYQNKNRQTIIGFSEDLLTGFNILTY